MYEHFRTQVLTLLQKYTDYENEQINTILSFLDRVAEGYEFSQKTTELAIYDEGGIPYAVKCYLATKAVESCSPGTLKLYGGRLKIFFEWVTIPLEKITANDIRLFLYEYKNRNPEKPVSDRTMDKFRSILANFFKWCVSEKYLTENPMENVSQIKFEVKPREALDQYELEQIRYAARDDLRDSAIIEFLYSTGCRAAELIIVKKDDIDWNNKTVHLFGKGRKHRTSYINAKAEVTIKKYLESREDDSEYLFVSKRAPHNPLSVKTIEDIIKKIMKKCPDIHKTVTPHIFRHTTATIALQNGMPIENVSKLLGHSQVSTTQIYAETSDDNIALDHKKYVI